MPGLVPGIHVVPPRFGPTWMAGTSPAMTRGRASLLRRLRGLVSLGLGGLDLGGLLLNQRDQMVDDVLVLEPMVRLAGDIDLVGVVAAAGEGDIGFVRLARFV